MTRDVGALPAVKTLPPLPAWTDHRHLQARLLKQLRELDPEHFATVTETDLIPLRNRHGLSVVTVAMEALVDRYTPDGADA